MSDSHTLSPEQRRQAADILCAQVRSWMEDPDSTFAVSVRRGLHARMNLATGVREMHPNGTATVVLEINGGARDVTGPDVLPLPGVVRQD
jgi:hypothetical protein